MKEKFITQKRVIASMLLSYSGIAILVVGTTILVISNVQQTWIKYPVILIGVIFMITGAFIMCEKCKCPYCDYGRGGRKDGKYHSLLSIGNIKRGYIICPRCGRTIKFR